MVIRTIWGIDGEAFIWEQMSDICDLFITLAY